MSGARGKKRWQLPGHTCRDCEAYYNSLPEEERGKHIQSSSRHRCNAKPPPKTPPGFWDIEFPSTPDYMAAGWMVDGDAAGLPKLKRRKRRRTWTPLDFSDVQTDKNKRPDDVMTIEKDDNDADIKEPKNVAAK